MVALIPIPMAKSPSENQRFMKNIVEYLMLGTLYGVPLKTARLKSLMVSLILATSCNSKLEVNTKRSNVDIITGVFSESTNVSTTGFTLNWTPISRKSDEVYCLCAGATFSDVESKEFCIAESNIIACGEDYSSQEVTGKLAGRTYYYNIVVKKDGTVFAIYEAKSQATLSSAESDS